MRDVLVTRPQPGAAETASRLKAMGYQPLLAPMLEIAYCAPQLPDGAAIQAVLVASANALVCLPSRLFPVTLLAVGAATAARARGQGFENVRSADGDADALAGLARRVCLPSGLPLLLVHGLGHGAALAAMLRSAGFTVLTAVAYRADPVGRLPAAADSAWRHGTIGSALFFSAETARALTQAVAGSGLHAGAGAIEALAISQTVAQALGALRWRDIRVAASPDQDALFALLSEPERAPV